jgi:DnaJ family protein C protein 3
MFFPFFFAGSDSTSQSEINKHLELGRDLLSRGQLQDALSHYHAAVGKCEFDIVTKQQYRDLTEVFLAVTSKIIVDENIILLYLQTDSML